MSAPTDEQLVEWGREAKAPRSTAAGGAWREYAADLDERIISLIAEVKRLRAASPGHTVAMRVADEMVVECVARSAKRSIWWEDHEEYDRVRAAIVTRVLGEPESEVARAEREVVEAAIEWHSPGPPGYDEDRGDAEAIRLAMAVDALLAAREKATASPRR